MNAALRVAAFTLLPLAAGIALSLRGLRAPGWLLDLSLHTLILLAGFEIGHTLPQQGNRLRKGLKIGVANALIVLASGLVVGALLAPITGLEPCASITIAAAGGWYSLAAPLLASSRPEAALLALAANMAREQLHLILYPVLAARSYRLEAVTIGGATTMDTGLPVVLIGGGEEASAAAITQGVLLTLVLPAVLPLLACQ